MQQKRIKKTYIHIYSKKRGAETKDRDKGNIG